MASSLPNASIQCPKCRYESGTWVEHCKNCGTPLVKLCKSCGFGNSLAKNYCDQCGEKLILPFSVSVSPPSPAPPTPIAGPIYTRLLPSIPLRLAIPIFLAGLLLSGAFFLYTIRPKLPRYLLLRAAHQYLTALNQSQFEKAYVFLSKTAQATCSPEDFKNLRDQTPWKFKDVEAVLIEPGLGLIKYKLKTGDKPWSDDYLAFSRENGRWRRPYVWNLFLKIDDAIKRNDFAQAHSLSQKAVQVNPKDAMAYGYLCQSTLMANFYPEAESACNRSLELSRIYPVGLSDESLLHIHATLAEAYKNLKKLPEMIREYTQLLSYPSLSPESRCEFLLARADSYIATQNYEAAPKDIIQADPFCPTPFKEQIRKALSILNGSSKEQAVSLVQNYLTTEQNPTLLQYNQEPPREALQQIRRRNRKLLSRRKSWTSEHLAGPLYRVTLNKDKPKEALLFQINLWTGVIALENSPHEKL